MFENELQEGWVDWVKTKHCIRFVFEVIQKIEKQTQGTGFTTLRIIQLHSGLPLPTSNLLRCSRYYFSPF